jgi:hypothetical protein
MADLQTLVLKHGAERGCGQCRETEQRKGHPFEWPLSPSRDPRPAQAG